MRPHEPITLPALPRKPSPSPSPRRKTNATKIHFSRPPTTTTTTITTIYYATITTTTTVSPAF
ncbi:hypothetical protein E2C01_031724 [Portunus trituberculatus]|uniref:Uncharacterized protein n=1 Tax=Portunus trituberculatus TaxID=210409 RepID=A0A5B7EYW8_PORTR|nr:hypothetical protein [Portunus trituberculatus]